MQKGPNLNSVKIQEIDFNSDGEVKRVARTYIEVPLSWDPDYKYTETMVEKTSAWLKEKQASLLCLTCWVDHDLVGLHILFFDKSSDPKDCFIKTLWIAPHYRGLGLSKKLKQMGESWAHAQNAKKIITHVFVKNKRMIALNERCGFIPHKLELHKDL